MMPALFFPFFSPLLWDSLLFFTPQSITVSDSTLSVEHRLFSFSFFSPPTHPQNGRSFLITFSAWTLAFFLSVQDTFGPPPSPLFLHHRD